jgi:hypothetical protein
VFPAATVYVKVNVFVPEPEVYVTAVDAGEPVARASVGVPVTLTISLNVIVTGMI